MKFLRSVLLACALTGAGLSTAALITGCQTPASRVVYNSLATTGTSVNSAYQGYLQVVAQGQCRTNMVPYITDRYREFKVLFEATAQAASFATNFVETPPAVAASASDLLRNIEIEKAQPLTK